LDDLTIDTVDAGTGTNTLSMVAGVDVANTLDFGTYTNFDQIVAGGASATAYSLDLKADADTDMSDVRTIDFSSDTNTTGNNVIDLGLVSGTYSVTGGAGKETITGSLGADTLTGGLGNDVFVVVSTEAAMDSITDFNTTTAPDVLDIKGTTLFADTGTSDITVASVTGVTGSAVADVASGIMTLATANATVDALSEWIDIAEAVLASTDQTTGAADAVLTVAFEFGGDTYVVTGTDIADVSGGAAETYATDSIIQLDGVTSITGLSTTASSGVIDIM
jgi:Ca2+-binding RTX toxin-like protein